jgi:tetratricopeptide (TPR) repeat protein
MNSTTRRPRGSARTIAICAVALTVVLLSFLISRVLHGIALDQVASARGQLAAGDTLAALPLLQKARWCDPFLVEARLVRGEAINQHVESTDWGHSRYSREDALTDLDWVIVRRPDFGKAHLERGRALAGLARVAEAREALAKAIPLLEDPTEALVERAALSFHTGDYQTAVQEISSAIERRPLEADYYETRDMYRSMLVDRAGAALDRRRAKILRSGEASTLEQLESLVNGPASLRLDQ